MSANCYVSRMPKKRGRKRYSLFSRHSGCQQENDLCTYCCGQNGFLYSHKTTVLENNDIKIQKWLLNSQDNLNFMVIRPLIPSNLI